MPYSERLKEVLGEPGGILVGLSGNHIAMRAAHSNEQLSNTVALELKRGWFGREGTALRILGRVYAPELLERHGDEIEEMYGRRAADAAVEWLLYVANPRLAVPPRRTPAGVSAIGLASPDPTSEILRRLERIEQRLPERDEETGSERFIRGLVELCRKHGRPVPVELDGEGTLTVAEAEAQLAEIDRQMVEGVI